MGHGWVEGFDVKLTRKQVKELSRRVQYPWQVEGVPMLKPRVVVDHRGMFYGYAPPLLHNYGAWVGPFREFKSAADTSRVAHNEWFAQRAFSWGHYGNPRLSWEDREFYKGCSI